MSWSASSAEDPSICAKCADIVDGAEEPSNYMLLRPRRGARRIAPDEEPAVTLSIAKRPGANAISVDARGAAQDRDAQGHAHPARCRGLDHAQLRRNRRGQIQRTPAPHGHRRHRRLAPHLAHARLARIGHRRPRHSRHARAHPARFLSARLHAEPHHALRADLLHRHPRR